MIDGFSCEVVGTPLFGFTPLFELFEVVDSGGHGGGFSCGLECVVVGTGFGVVVVVLFVVIIVVVVV